MTTLRVRVTQRHIWLGRQNLSQWCPVAWALKSIGMKYPFVDRYEIYFTDESGYRHFAKTTRRAARFIDRVDRGFRVKPFRFQLRLKFRLGPKVSY